MNVCMQTLVQVEEFQMVVYGINVLFQEESGKICLPGPKNLPLGVEKVPYVFVGDDAFALKPYLMKPYPQCGLTNDKRIYNYHHSRARRISENLFGIIAIQWRVFCS